MYTVRLKLVNELDLGDLWDFSHPKEALDVSLAAGPKAQACIQALDVLLRHVLSENPQSVHRSAWLPRVSQSTPIGLTLCVFSLSDTQVHDLWIKGCVQAWASCFLARSRGLTVWLSLLCRTQALRPDDCQADRTRRGSPRWTLCVGPTDRLGGESLSVPYRTSKRG